MSSLSVDMTQDDINQAKESNQPDSEPVPEGQYDAIIFDAELNETRNTYKFGDEERTSKYLNVQFRITNGEYEDRRVFDIFMTETPDQKHPKNSDGTVNEDEWVQVPSDQSWNSDLIYLFEAIGRTDELTGDDDIELDSLYGEELRINTYIEEDDEYGDKARISYVEPPAGSSDDSDDFIPPE